MTAVTHLLMAVIAIVAARWTCEDCGHINPDITGTCRMCGRNGGHLS